MEQPERILGRIVSLDIPKRRVTIEVDFFDPDKQEQLEILLKEQKQFSFAFWKPFRQTKTYAQLKKYYLTIHQLLIKIGEDPTSAKVKTLDDEFKKRVFNCDNLEFFSSSLPMLPSKATMSWEDMSKLIQYIYDNYEIVIEENN
jgi:hypothetical protein